MSTQDAPSDHKRRNGWLPANQDDLETWLEGHQTRVDARPADKAMQLVVTEFRELIDTEPVVRLYLTEMIDQVPRNSAYRKRHLKNVDQLLLMIDEVLTTAPEFSDGGMVTTPLTAILDWTMGTPAGFAAYRDPRINGMFQKILQTWGEFLSSPDSRYVLNDSPQGWKSEAAKQIVGIDDYRHDPAKQYWGFTSWNDFFTRRLTATSRPVASPEDDSVILSSCESTPYKISTGVQRRDRFWVKSQPYSLEDMLANDPSVDKFVGGTVYQAFLSALNYHRWHSPVSGTVLRAFVQPGTYFSEADSEGTDATEPKNSEGYLPHVSARAILIIRADNPNIGLVAVIAVGMIEVSSCIIDPEVTPGHHLNKGDELGYFQFGGSTECLVFQPGAIHSFTLCALPQPENPEAKAVKVRSHLATAQTPAPIS
ncbi:phosphatidylserine decarboxylase [Frondihabitans sp. PhB188]|uniref:phosphatidylserine decarboxylase family protein n=1 Tax=Frondihabitans sp. PhB188 TaxID=2485200 RepID=UPI000F46C9ED|nr:phosphatidylserine decarboxylase family protein [Frondihabitans sp. PhB188]ROQ30916.1 phosphatidylserine decarboxylase [Frondihabitans sp. PhB188]